VPLAVQNCGVWSLPLALKLLVELARDFTLLEGGERRRSKRGTSVRRRRNKRSRTVRGVAVVRLEEV